MSYVTIVIHPPSHNIFVLLADVPSTLSLQHFFPNSNVLGYSLDFMNDSTLFFVSSNKVPSAICRCSRPATLLEKETLAQVFSCEFCEISKNTFSYWTPPVAASAWWRNFLTEKSLYERSKLLYVMIFLFYLSYHVRNKCA